MYETTTSQEGFRFIGVSRRPGLRAAGRKPLPDTVSAVGNVHLEIAHQLKRCADELCGLNYWLEIISKGDPK